MTDGRFLLLIIDCLDAVDLGCLASCTRALRRLHEAHSSVLWMRLTARVLCGQAKVRGPFSREDLQDDSSQRRAFRRHRAWRRIYQQLHRYRFDCPRPVEPTLLRNHFSSINTVLHSRPKGWQWLLVHLDVDPLDARHLRLPGATYALSVSWSCGPTLKASHPWEVYLLMDYDGRVLDISRWRGFGGSAPVSGALLPKLLCDHGYARAANDSFVFLQGMLALARRH